MLGFNLQLLQDNVFDLEAFDLENAHTNRLSDKKKTIKNVEEYL